jgi:hypothetical protein
MKTFSMYVEGREEQMQLIQRALNGLCYQKGLDPASICSTESKTLIEELKAMGLVPIGWSDIRFAAAVKQMAQEISGGQHEA